MLINALPSMPYAKLRNKQQRWLEADRRSAVRFY